ncbi:MAG: dihydrolipoyllysine-residue acetyltransferase [Calditrichia bacterium]
MKDNTMAYEFKLPELGENIETGIVSKLLVAVGDKIETEQNILELETEKAVVEVPSGVSGVVQEIKVKEGDEVRVGQVILVIEEQGESLQPKPQATAKKELPGKAHPAEPEISRAEVGEEAKKPTSMKAEQPKPAGKIIEFLLPELGENVVSGVVTRLLISEGDFIKADQNILELETEKAVVEVPANVSGVIQKIFIKEGDEIKVGQKILSIAVAERGSEKTQEEVEELVATTPGEELPPIPAEEKPALQPEIRPTPGLMERAGEKPAEAKRPPVPASPSTRRFAREIGVDIYQVTGSGPGGRITIEDVKNYSRMLHQQRQASGAVLRGIEPEPLPDFSRWGEIERKPMSSVRQKTARHLGYAWATVAHVTQFDKADITELEKFRKQFSGKAEEAGGKLTATVMLLKIVASALKVFPQFNASIDMEKNEIIYKKYYHIGVAVDTDRGLLVPVIRNVDQKNIIQLSVELSEMARKARERKLTLEEMQGGNFSISNLGGIGGTGFTPIVHSPEVAILGVSRAVMEPVFIEGTFEPRLMLPLSLSYDHRLIDGADAARFLRWVAEAIEQPFLILLEG